MSKRLAEYFVEHAGFLCDKWEHYVSVYDAELSRFRSASKPIELLEIGVQNGGSLQLWARFLPPGSRITGIDIDAACASLNLGDNITVLIGDATDPAGTVRLLGGRTFDIIIDDGSHRSPDIIAAFQILFDRLNLGGLYFAEDLHCSYLTAFGGGFRSRGAAVEWFKDMVEAINFDHIPDAASMTLDEVRRLARINRSIARVSFYDSMAVIEKLTQQKTRPYQRIMSGHDAPVVNPAASVFNMAPRQIEAIRVSPALSEVLSPIWTGMLATAKEDLAIKQAELDKVRVEANEADARSSVQIAELVAELEKVREAANEAAARLSARITKRANELVLAQARLRQAERDRTDLVAVLSATSTDLASARHEVARSNNEISDLTSELQRFRALHDAMLASTSWRISWPVRAAKRVLRDPAIVARKVGMARTRGLIPGSAVSLLAAPATTTDTHANALVSTADDAAEAIRARYRYQRLQPPRIFRVLDQPRRVTMITDSISEGSLFGGVGTAIVLAAAIAHHTGVALRVVTCLHPPNPANFATVMATHRRPLPTDVDFIYAPPDESSELEISDTELFLTTSWWSTRSIRKIINPARIIYLLQEDERMFYPNGDDRLNCQETLADEKIRFIVNSRLLFDHLIDGPEALASVKSQGVWFEPAFPALAAAEAKPVRQSVKRNFFFYARPTNLRNLYWHGLEAIVESIEDGILDPGQWEFHFVGRDLMDVELPGGVRPVLHQNLPWPDYVALIKTIDVGLSLMATPHPSYPPLDLAAAGAVVVTNRYGRKTSLDQYSRNIICTDPTVDALKQGIAEAVTRAANPNRPDPQDHMLRDWDVAFRPVLKRLFTTAHQD